MTTLQHAAAQALVDQVRSATRGRYFLVRFDDNEDSRAAGLPPPLQRTPPALKRLLLNLSPALHQVVYGSNNPFLQSTVPRLLPMGVCLVKRAPTATGDYGRYATQQEKEDGDRKYRARARRYWNNQEFEQMLDNERGWVHGKLGKRRR